MDMMSQLGFWSMISGATLVVKSVLILLGAMSLGSWTIIFFKWIQLAGVRRRALRDLEEFEATADLSKGVEVLRNAKDSPLYPIAFDALAEMRQLEKSSMHPSLLFRVSGENLKRVLTQGVSKQLGQLASTLSFLGTCANAAPFIGLFGTVWGIMHSFHSIGLQKTAALAAVAPGISEALVATAIGLGVAIPAAIAYNSFLGLLNGIETELGAFSGSFLNRAQRELPWMHGGTTKKE
ncbi:MotA/TolQ/ExbB proton channel family protein [Desulfoplanes sp. PS50]